MITAPQELKPEDIPDAPADPWVSTLVSYVNNLGRQLVPTANSQPKFSFVDVDMVHGVAQRRANPLGTTIQGVYPMWCYGRNTDTTGKVTVGNYPLGLPQIEWHPSGLSDGSIIVTSLFPYVGPYLELQPTADQSLNDSATVAVTWTPQTADPLGVITLTSNGSAPLTTRVTVSKPGLYQFSGNVTWDNGGTGQRITWTCKNSAGAGNTENRGRSNMPPSAGPTSNTLLAEWPLAANDYVEVFGFQTSGSPLKLLGTVDYRSKLRVRRIDWAPTNAGVLNPTGRVRLLLVGGI